MEPIGLLFNGQYSVQYRISRNVFQAFDVLNKGCGNGVVMKIEPQENSAAVARFSREADAYQRLSNIPGVATLYWHGYEHGYLAIALENLALDLRSIYNSRGSFFPLSMIMDLGVQMLETIRNIHERGLLHRNIQPNNIMFDTSLCNKPSMYFVDYAYATPYAPNGRHIPENPSDGMYNFLDNPCFASINALSGDQQSRRDDIESIAYILMYLWRDRLPWLEPQVDFQWPSADAIQNGQLSSSDAINLEYYAARYVSCKRHMVESNKIGFDQPPELQQLLNHARRLSFSGRPNYENMIETLKKGSARIKREEKEKAKLRIAQWSESDGSDWDEDQFLCLEDGMLKSITTKVRRVKLHVRDPRDLQCQ